MKRRDLLVAAMLAVAAAALTLQSSRALGLTRDEAYYMAAGERYVGWIEDVVSGRTGLFDAAAIDRAWAYNAEHPPLMKLLYGLSWRVFHRCRCAESAPLHPPGSRLAPGERHLSLGWLGEIEAFRLPAAVTLGLLAGGVYLFSTGALGTPLGGLAAALLMVAQPRAFFHSQTAALDLPAAALWLACVALYLHAVRTGTARASLGLGAVWGVFLGVKLQALLFPGVVLAHTGWLWLRARRSASARPPLLLPLAGLGMAGPLVLLSSWPWLWHDPVARLAAYLRFHWRHVHYHFEYLGRDWVRPPFPWHAPLVELLLTAPLVLLVLAAAGAILLVRRPPAALGRDPLAVRALLLLAALVPVAPFLTGRAPLYGATKHWLGAMPVLAIAAGYAVDRLATAVATEHGLGGRRRAALAAAVVALAVAPAAAETWRSQPYGLSHYNALAGGAPGGADLGMNRQFWGYSVRGVLPWLNARLPPRAEIYFHDANRESYELYVRSGLLRSDLAHQPVPGVALGEAPSVAGGRPAGAALIVHERHFLADEIAIWEALGHARPAAVLTHDGVPLVSVYRRTEETPPR